MQAEFKRKTDNLQQATRPTQAPQPTPKNTTTTNAPGKSPTKSIAPPAKPIPPKVNAPPTLDEACLNNVEEALKTVTSCCQAMEENATKQTVMIEALTKLIQTQHTNFTNTLNHQQVLSNNLQAHLANTKKAHNRKINALMNLGIDNFNLLDKKLDQHGEVIIIKTDEVMKHAEENINEVVLTEEEFEKIVDEMADQLFEKSMDLPYEKKTKKTMRPKMPTTYRMMNSSPTRTQQNRKETQGLRRPGRRTQRPRA